MFNLNDIFILGIEGTAWNFSTAIISSDGVIAESKNTYVPNVGGIHPREAAQHHANVAASVIKDLIDKFQKCGYSINSISAISFSKGPGLGPCLRITGTVARMLSLMLKKPLIGVNHCIAHIEIGMWNTKAIDPIILYVSGANSQILTFNNSKYRILGETLDIGLGNSLDKFARSAGLQHPGGPKIELLSKKATSFVELPYTVKGMDLFYSGLSAEATRKLIINNNEKIINLENLCYSYQEIAFSMIVEVVERALSHTQKREVLLVGGVGANLRLQKMLLDMCNDRNCSFKVPEMKYLGDNGVMIAYTGLLMYKCNCFTDIKLSNIDASFRPDTIDILWRKNISCELKEESIQDNIFFGAEAQIKVIEINNKKYIIKNRIEKKYRIDELDSFLRSTRTKNEVRMILESRKIGIRTPII